MRLVFLIITFYSFLVGDIHVFNRRSSTESEIKTIEVGKTLFISAKGLSSSLSSKIYENAERRKLVLYISGSKIKISGYSSFIIIDEKIFQMAKTVNVKDNDLYIPANDFFDILKSSIMPGVNFDPLREILEINVIKYDITNIDIDVKSNGTIIRLGTKKPFAENGISSFINKHGWYYLTISGGVVDTATINLGITRGAVRQIESDQIGSTAQVAFKLGSKVLSHEWFQSLNPNEIIITLRTPIAKRDKYVEQAKARWRLDTIVLDAGHGGKDPGAIGKFGTKEKDVALDITMRTGSLLEKSGIKVVYTRDEDVFIPLLDRTKIANDANGKLFVSIHANANQNRKIQGFETYLLRPGKSEDAIEVASRENSVIKLEDVTDQYENLSGENLIMATMAQSTFMKESEDLASIIQIELDKKLDTPNRGVKQAGFYVLIGASMPNALVEVGFLSNPNEEKMLKQSRHKQKIAEAIYYAIKSFKSSQEKLLVKD
ncbi:MAG: N-acetylmuramoyl-L-alanine amidase [Candidatus Neomarinimicrobiota bacterium]